MTDEPRCTAMRQTWEGRPCPHGHYLNPRNGIRESMEHYEHCSLFDGRWMLMESISIDKCNRPVHLSQFHKAEGLTWRDSDHGAIPHKETSMPSDPRADEWLVTKLMEYTDWLDDQGLLPHESDHDQRTHSDLVEEFLNGPPDPFEGWTVESACGADKRWWADVCDAAGYVHASFYGDEQEDVVARAQADLQRRKEEES